MEGKKLGLLAALTAGAMLTTAAQAFPVFVSTSNNANIDGEAFMNDDIINADAGTGTSVFDVGDVVTSDINVDALSILADGTIIFSMSNNGDNTTTDSGITFQDEDLIALDPTTGTTSLFLDMTDLVSNPATLDIDAVDILPNGNVLVSTSGNTSIGTNGLAVDNDQLIEIDPNTGVASSFLDNPAALFDTNINIDSVDFLDVGLVAFSTAQDEVANDGTIVLNGDVVVLNIASGEINTLFSEVALFGPGSNEQIDAFSVNNSGSLSLLGIGLVGLIGATGFRRRS